jgi:hypothetical protein
VNLLNGVRIVAVQAIITSRAVNFLGGSNTLHPERTRLPLSGFRSVHQGVMTRLRSPSWAGDFRWITVGLDLQRDLSLYLEGWDFMHDQAPVTFSVGYSVRTGILLSVLALSL